MAQAVKECRRAGKEDCPAGPAPLAFAPNERASKMADGGKTMIVQAS
jgi:hypothetical protein